MNLKNETRKMGKRIRQQTGLNLTVCMRAAHFIVRGRGYDLINHVLVGEHVKFSMFSCGPDCCGAKGYELQGSYDL